MFEQITKYINSNRHILAIVAAGIVVAGIGFYLYSRYKKSSPQTAAVQDRPVVQDQPSPSPAEEPVFVLFHANWCPHCKNMMGEWAKTESALSGKFNVRQIESSDPDLVPHKIDSFPTVRMFPRGINNSDIYVDYKGPRDAEHMIKFALYGPDDK